MPMSFLSKGSGNVSGFSGGLFLCKSRWPLASSAERDSIPRGCVGAAGSRSTCLLTQLYLRSLSSWKVTQSPKPQTLHASVSGITIVTAIANATIMTIIAINHY